MSQTLENNEPKNRPQIFASDLDGTLLPLRDEEQSTTLVNSVNSYLRDANGLLTVFATGRDRNLAIEGLTSHGILAPQCLITDVGTKVSFFVEGSWVYDAAFDSLLREHWPQGSDARVIEALQDIPAISLQEKSKQSELKVSFYCSPEDVEDCIQTAIRPRLQKIFSKFQLISSIDPEGRLALIDILPPTASKLTALHFVAEKLGVERNAIVYAGDSGNDRAVFLSGIASILVANTPHQLKEETHLKASAEGWLERIYIAKKEATAGVLEGLAHFSRQGVLKL